MEQSKVLEASKDVAAKLDHAQEMFRNDQYKLCLAYLETVVEQGAVYWYAMCMLLCQGLVMDMPPCHCPKHKGAQPFDAQALDARTMQPATDPLYAFSSEILAAFAKKDWAGFVDRLQHVAGFGRETSLACLLLSRLTQLQDQKAAGLL
jgi:hypothetical protein